MGFAVCFMSKKNCSRKGCGVPSWLIEVLFVDLSVHVLGLPRSSNM